MTRVIITRTEWEHIVADLDGDTQNTLAAALSEWEEAANVEYTPDRLGRIDSHSSPRYTSDQPGE